MVASRTCLSDCHRRLKVVLAGSRTILRLVRTLLTHCEVGLLLGVLIEPLDCAELGSELRRLLSTRRAAAAVETAGSPAEVDCVRGLIIDLLHRLAFIIRARAGRMLDGFLTLDADGESLSILTE